MSEPELLQRDRFIQTRSDASWRPGSNISSKFLSYAPECLRSSRNDSHTFAIVNQSLIFVTDTEADENPTFFDFTGRCFPGTTKNIESEKTVYSSSGVIDSGRLPPRCEMVNDQVLGRFFTDHIIQYDHVISIFSDEPRIDPIGFYNRLMLGSDSLDYLAYSVCYVERLVFKEKSVRSMLAQRLIELATQFAAQTEPSDDLFRQAAFAAVRKSASMMEPIDYPILLDLLDTNYVTDLVEVVLVAIINILEKREIREHKCRLEESVSRIATYNLEHFSNEDVAGQTKLLRSIVLLHILSSSNIEPLVSEVYETLPTWFGRYLGKQIGNGSGIDALQEP